MSEQKKRIIKEAARMFRDMGLKSVRMDDIAMQLGVSKRTLYEMFGDKKELLEECVRYNMEQKHCALQEKAAGAKNVVEEIFMIIYSMKRDEKDMLLIMNLKKFYPDIYRKLEEEAYRNSYEQIGQLLDKGIKEGLFLPDMNKQLALMTLIYTMAALFERKFYFPDMDKITPRDAFEYVLANFFRGLATHKGVELIDELVKKHKETRGQLNAMTEK